MRASESEPQSLRGPIRRLVSILAIRFRKQAAFRQPSVSAHHQSLDAQQHRVHMAGGVDSMQRNNSPFRGVVAQADIMSLPTFQTAHQRGADEIAALRQLAAVDQ